MAYKIIGWDAPGSFKDADGILIDYVCDSESDIASLPTGASASAGKTKPRPGSRAGVPSVNKVYYLTCDREWKEVGYNEGGNG